jgi:Protein O-mannosyl-transferase TMEM260-like
MTRGAGPAAVAVTALAFVIYRATMMPGVELGDSASFQVMVGSPVITPRDAYPLYFAIADVIHWLSGGAPARALNLASVIEGAVACGLVTLVAIELSGGVLAGVAGALMFAGSYTFWSQSIIAEVYALHILLIALTLWLLLGWADEPTPIRLTAFFAAFAVSFGNHLAMILLAPAYAIFLLVSAPMGWRSIVTPRVVLLAALCAVAGSAQYAWNLSALWLALTPPPTWRDGLATFWIDVTKADWRDTMVLNVPAQMAAERLRMYAFDATQQFGWFGLALAFVGAIALVRANARRAALVLAAYATTVLFALAYNVGDSHVFFLPSHLMVALLASVGLAALGRLVASQPAAVALGLLMVAARMYRDYPALDRSEDWRPTRALEALTAELDDRQSILISDLNWQLQNGLNYFARFDRPEVAFAPLPEIASYAPVLISDNLAIGREVVSTSGARAALDAAYGPRLSARLDERLAHRGLPDVVRDLSPGTRYVLCYIRPSIEFLVDGEAVRRTLGVLIGRTFEASSEHDSAFTQSDFAVIAGVVGKGPHLRRVSDRPFREALNLDGTRVEVRMESWPVFDTIRRMGFGQVVAGRKHALIVERGLSFVAFDSDGRPLQAAYEANIFMPQRRYLITTNPP